MSCEDCEEKQKGNTAGYYRWKNANVCIIACSKHLTEVINFLNGAGDARKEDRPELSERLVRDK